MANRPCGERKKLESQYVKGWDSRRGEGGVIGHPSGPEAETKKNQLQMECGKEHMLIQSGTEVVPKERKLERISCKESRWGYKSFESRALGMGEWLG